jgi:hypothetical protein
MSMTDALIVAAIITAFGTFAFTLAWGEAQTRNSSK